MSQQAPQQAPRQASVAAARVCGREWAYRTGAYRQRLYAKETMLVS